MKRIFKCDNCDNGDSCELEVIDTGKQFPSCPFDIGSNWEVISHNNCFKLIIPITISRELAGAAYALRNVHNKIVVVENDTVFYNDCHIYSGVPKEWIHII